MTREECVALVEGSVKNVNLRKHMLAAEAVMGALAERLGEDVHAWATAGLVHDIDIDDTAEMPERHGLVSAEKLDELGFPAEIIHAVKAHNNHVPRESTMDKALFASDPVTGLIVAAALMHPSKTLAGVDLQFVTNRFSEKRFAAGASRDQIRTCEEFGLGLDDFLGIALKAMQGISTELGL